MTLLMIGVSSTPAQAQGVWPPFTFSVTPVYEAGQITCNLFFLSYLEGGDASATYSNLNRNAFSAHVNANT